MGKILQLRPSQILPSQDFLKEDTLGFILKCLENGADEKLPPMPLVRCNPEAKNFIAIDGHNLLAIYDLLGQDCEVYLAESDDDRLIGSVNAIAQRNQELADKYEQALAGLNKLAQQGIASFSDLRKRYPYLANWEEAKKHFKI